jgi:hypothetical protein
MRDILKKFKECEDSDKMNKKVLEERQITIQSLNKHKQNMSQEIKAALEENLKMKESVEGNLSKAQRDRLLDGKRSRWSPNDFAAALVLLAAGKRGYTYLSSQYTFLLPCLSSIKNYMTRITFEPGQLDDVLSLMEFAGKDMTPLHKILVMGYDEMHTSETCCHDQKLDQIYGPCQQVQVVNVRGLFSPYKNPVFFDFDCKIEGVPEKLSEELHKRGFMVAAIVCDLGTNNQKFFRQAGVSIERPYLPHPVTSQKIFCLFDPPHNLKLARNYLLDEEIHLDYSDPSKSRIASKAPLLELVALPPIPDLRTHKVRLHHLTVQGSERQNVLTASQVASESASMALLDAFRRSLIKSQHSEVVKNYNLINNLQNCLK